MCGKMQCRSATQVICPGNLKQQQKEKKKKKGTVSNQLALKQKSNRQKSYITKCHTLHL